MLLNKLAKYWNPDDSTGTAAHYAVIGPVNKSKPEGITTYHKGELVRIIFSKSEADANTTANSLGEGWFVVSHDEYQSKNSGDLEDDDDLRLDLG